MKMKKLLIVTQKVNILDDNLGFFHRWIELFAQHCDEVLVICLESGKYSLPSNVTVLSLGKEEGNTRIKFIQRFFSYIWKYRNNYDAVFVHMNTEYIVLAGWFWKLLRKPIYLWRMHKSVNAYMRFAVFWITKAFSASKDSFRLSTKKLVVTGHGVDLNLFQTSFSQKTFDSIHLISTGRISRVKRYEVLLDALKELRSVDPKVDLVVVGGPITEDEKQYFGFLKKYAENAGVASSVIWVGGVPHQEVKTYLEKANIFISASSTGSLDKAGLEALLSGLMVISSNDSFYELFGSDVQYGTFTAGNSHDLVRKIRQFISLPLEVKEKILSRVRDTISEKHSVEILIPRLVKEMQLSV